MKLLIGSRKRREGWKTLDIEPGPEVDFTGDCKDLSQFADASIAEIYASHVLEHLSYQKELSAALKEWFRVLAPGGLLRISVPDLEILSQLFTHPQLDDDARLFVMRIMFGGQLDSHDFHHIGFWWTYLKARLDKVGFHDITRVKEFGLFHDTSTMKVGGVPISLNVTARKPG